VPILSALPPKKKTLKTTLKKTHPTSAQLRFKNNRSSPNTSWLMADEKKLTLTICGGDFNSEI